MSQLKRLTALIAAPILGLCLVTNLLASGMVTLTFDDGLAGVSKYALPILKKYGFCGVSGVIFSKLTSGDATYMNPAELLGLQNQGWEIASQGLHNAKPIQVPKFLKQELIRGWYIDDDKNQVYQVNYEYDKVLGLLENGRKLSQVCCLNQVALTPGSYYFDPIIEELHMRPFNPLPPDKLEILALSYEREMQSSRDELRKLGFNVETFITPYNFWSSELSEACHNYYKFAVSGKDSANRKVGLNPGALTRFVVHSSDSANAVIRLVREQALERDDWVILSLHSIGDNVGWQPWPAENLEKLCAWLSENKIPVLTVTQAMSRLTASERKTAK